MTAPLHMMKLCVGASGPDELARWQRDRFGGAPAQHVTRMWPKRQDELLAGGSIFWVFKGTMLARQRILDLQQRTGGDGITRCALLLDPKLVPVAAVPRRAFQGWRYLKPGDAPPDVPATRAAETAQILAEHRGRQAHLDHSLPDFTVKTGGAVCRSRNLVMSDSVCEEAAQAVLEHLALFGQVEIHVKAPGLPWK